MCVQARWSLLLPVYLAKQSRSNFFPSLSEKIVCAQCPQRSKGTKLIKARIHNAIIKSHKAVSSSTGTRWLKSLLKASGVSTTIFSAHSVRGALFSAAASAVISTSDTLKAVSQASKGFTTDQPTTLHLV